MILERPKKFAIAYLSKNHITVAAGEDFVIGFRDDGLSDTVALTPSAANTAPGNKVYVLAKKVGVLGQYGKGLHVEQEAPIRNGSDYFHVIEDEGLEIVYQAPQGDRGGQPSLIGEVGDELL